MDTKNTTKVTIEEVLIRDLIKAKNPGVDFQIQMGKAGIEEVLVDGEPVNVSFFGEISPRKPDESHWSFYAADVDFHKNEDEAAKREYRPPYPILDHYLLEAALHMKNPNKKFSVICRRGKLVAVTGMHNYELNEDGIIIIMD